MQLTNKRIDFVDLARGLCMIIIIMLHCNVINVSSPLYAMSMTSFYILSGMFWKYDNHIVKFLIKKTNTILIPFLFFYFCSCLLAWLTNIFIGDFIPGDKRTLLYYMAHLHSTNGPLWFLLSLFWCNLILYILFALFTKWQITICVIIVSSIGIILSHMKTVSGLYIETSCFSLPFFYLGYMLNNTTQHNTTQHNTTQHIYSYRRSDIFVYDKDLRHYIRFS